MGTTAAPETTVAPTTAAPETTTAAPITTASTTTQKYTTIDCTQTTAAPTTAAPTPQPSGKCSSSCQNCVAIPGNFQAASDSACSACGANGQTWWPCNEDDLCHCADSADVHV